MMGLTRDKKEGMPFLGILVCQSQSVLDHKKKNGKLSDGDYCFWEFGKNRFPSRIKQLIYEISEGRTGSYSEVAQAPDTEQCGDDDFILPAYQFYVRFFFAVGGIVRGYFKVYRVDTAFTELRFHSEDWISTPPVRIKPSQGFRYFPNAKREKK